MFCGTSRVEPMVAEATAHRIRLNSICTVTKRLIRSQRIIGATGRQLNFFWLPSPVGNRTWSGLLRRRRRLFAACHSAFRPAMQICDTCSSRLRLSTGRNAQWVRDLPLNSCYSSSQNKSRRQRGPGVVFAKLARDVRYRRISRVNNNRLGDVLAYGESCPRWVAICQMLPQASRIIERRSPWGMSCGSSIDSEPQFNAR
jgi:hypothetical protein